MREPEVLHREQIARVRARDPWPVATPSASFRERFELLMQPLESMIGQAVNPVVEDALHVRTKPTVWRRGVAPILGRAALRPPAMAALEHRPRVDLRLRPTRTLLGGRSRAMHAAGGSGEKCAGASLPRLAVARRKREPPDWWPRLIPRPSSAGHRDSAWRTRASRCTCGFVWPG